MNDLEKFAKERAAAMREVGTLAPCPKCSTPRVQRSDYIRCNTCGLNWLDGEDLNSDPRIARVRANAVAIPEKRR